jgi:hypothetical protein
LALVGLGVSDDLKLALFTVGLTVLLDQIDGALRDFWLARYWVRGATSGRQRQRLNEFEVEDLNDRLSDMLRAIVAAQDKRQSGAGQDFQRVDGCHLLSEFRQGIVEHPRSSEPLGVRCRDLFGIQCLDMHATYRAGMTDSASAKA